MALYLFYFSRAGGAAASFEAHELETYAQVEACARRLLSEHPSCSAVEVWAGDRRVTTQRRTSRPGDVVFGRPPAGGEGASAP